VNALDLGTLMDTGKPVRLKMPSDEGYQLTILGASGSGKTNALYRLIEQIPKDRPVFIADPEQDFIPLRRHRDFVLVGKGRDIPADPSLAPLLAKRFLESGFNIIWDSHEEKKKELRELFLKAFLETLHDAPRSMWRAATLVLDELDIWAPESGSGESKATEACASAAKRFRKRGFDLVMATTRPADVDKTVISMSRNWLIGLSNIDTDVKRSLSFLGFTEKEDRAAYRALQRAEFYARGPEFGLLRPVKILVSQSDLYDPKANRGAAVRPPAAKGQIKKLIEELKDLPKQAEEEARSIADLQRQVRDLGRQLKEAQRGVPKTDPAAIDKAYQKGLADARAEGMKMQSQQEKVIGQLERKLQEAVSLLGALRAAPKLQKTVDVPTKNHSPAAPHAHVLKTPAQPRPAHSADRSLARFDRLALNLLANVGKPLSKAQVGGFTGYSVTSSSFDKGLSTLRSAGLIQTSGDQIQLTVSVDHVVRLLGSEFNSDFMPSIDGWERRLGKAPRALFGVLRGRAGETISKEVLAEESGYSITSSSFDKSLSELCSKKLAERVHNGVRLNPELLDL
jgi:hypothetical protein